MGLREEIMRRRTFAIISHPDAGKTTLTEKFLLYGGAIAQAGAVKGYTQEAISKAGFTVADEAETGENETSGQQTGTEVSSGTAETEKQQEEPAEAESETPAIVPEPTQEQTQEQTQESESSSEEQKVTEESSAQETESTAETEPETQAPENSDS